MFPQAVAVHRRAIGLGHCFVGKGGIAHPIHVHFLHLASQPFSEHLRGFTDGIHHFGVRGIDELTDTERDLSPFHIIHEMTEIITGQHLDGCWVKRIVNGNDLQHHRCVPDAGRQRTHVIEIP